MKKTSKFLLFTMATVLSLGMYSCDEIADATKQKVTVDAPDVEFTIDSTEYNMAKASQTADVVILDINMELSIADELENNGISVDKFVSGELANATLTITAPENVLLNFFDEISLFVVDGEEELLIANATSVDAESNTINLTCNNDNILDYINVDPVHIIIKVNPITYLPVPYVTITVSTAYQVEVEIL